MFRTKFQRAIGKDLTGDTYNCIAISTDTHSRAAAAATAAAANATTIYAIVAV